MTANILQALADVTDVEKFRLGGVMRQLGLNPRQPVLFYRALIAEARQVTALLSQLHDRIAELENARAQAEARLALKENEVRGSSGNIAWLQAENTELRQIAADNQDDAAKYASIKAFLEGQTDTDTLKALSSLMSDAYMAALEASVGLRSPPDLSQLSRAREWLKADLRYLLIQEGRDV